MTSSLAARVPIEEAYGAEPISLVIHNDLARTELGLRTRPAETTTTETAESFQRFGLLDAHE